MAMTDMDNGDLNDTIEQAYSTAKKEAPMEATKQEIDQVEQAYSAAKQIPFVDKSKETSEDYTKTLGRQVGLAARYGVEGSPVVSIPLAAGDAINKGLNYGINGLNNAAGTNIPTLGMPSQTFSNALTQLGLPNPETPTERVVGDASRAVAGAGGFIKAGNALMDSGNALAQGVGKTLSSSPKLQAASAALSAGAGGTAREMGANPLTQLAVSLAAGGALPAGQAALDSAASRASNGLRPEVKQLAQDAAKDYGIDIPAAKITNNPFVKWLDSALPAVPFSGHGGELEAAKTQFSRAVSRTFGSDTPTLNRATMDEAGARLGEGFQEVADKTPNIALNENAIAKLGAIKNDAAEVLGQDSSKISGQIDKITDLAKDGSLSGKSWQAMMRTGTPLDRLSKSTDPNVAFYARGIKDSLFDALGESASPELVDQYNTLKGQWKNYKTVEDLAAKSGVTGEISPLKLLTQTAKTAKKFGSGNIEDLQKLGDIGQTFFHEMPKSGTPEKLQALTTVGDLSSAGTALLSGNPLIAAKILGAGAAYSSAGRAASAALNSQWYKNALLNGGQGVAPYYVPAAVAGSGNPLSYQNR